MATATIAGSTNFLLNKSISNDELTPQLTNYLVFDEDEMANSNNGASPYDEPEDDELESFIGDDTYDSSEDIREMLPSEDNRMIPLPRGNVEEVFNVGFGHGKLEMPFLTECMWRYLEHYPIVSDQLQSYNRLVTDLLPMIIGGRHNKFIVNRQTLYVFYENVTINSPVRVIGGSERPLYPKFCSDTSSTYSTTVYCDMVVRSSLDQTDTPLHTRPRKALFNIPVMLRSIVCNTHDLTPQQLILIGENPYGVGGSFIIRGTERIVLGQEQLATNRIMLMNNKDYGVICRLTANTIRGTSLIQLVTQPKTKNLIVIHLSSVQNKIKKLAENGKDDVAPNVLYIFQFLGYDTEMTIELIKYFLPLDQQSKCLGKLVENQVDIAAQPDGIVRIIQLMKLTNLTPDEQAAEINRIISNDLFPHLNYLPGPHQETIDEHRLRLHQYKAYLLAAMTARYLQYMSGYRKLDDRNSIANKRFEWAGRAMEQFIRTGWRRIIADLQEEINSNKVTSFDGIVQALRSESLTSSFDVSFAGSKWGPKGAKPKNNVATVLDTTTLISEIGHKVTGNVPAFRGDVRSSIREIVLSQYGLICPAATPEGDNCGMLKQLALLARITLEHGDYDAIKVVLDGDLVVLTPDAEHSTQVFVYGKFLGWGDGAVINNEYRRLRREGYLSREISLVWDHRENVFYVDCGPGLLIHPVLPLVNNVPVLLNPITIVGRHYDRLADAPLSDWFTYGGIEYLSAWEEFQPELKIADRYEDVIALQHRKEQAAANLRLTRRQLKAVKKYEAKINPHLEIEPEIEIPDEIEDEIEAEDGPVYIDQFTVVTLTVEQAEAEYNHALERLNLVKGGKAVLMRNALVVITLEEAESLLQIARHELEVVKAGGIIQKELRAPLLLTVERAQARYDDAEFRYRRVMEITDYTHCQFDGQVTIGLLAAMVSYGDRDQQPRVTYQIGMGKQAPGANDNYFNSTENKQRRLLYPQMPVAQTEGFRYLRLHYKNGSQNVLLALLAARSNQEDGTKWNAATITNGVFWLAKTLIYTARFDSPAEMTRPIPNLRERPDRYDALGPNGLPYIGAYIKQGQCIIGRMSTSNGTSTQWNASVHMHYTEEGIVQNVWVYRDTRSRASPSIVVVVQLTMTPRPQLGDKGAGLHAQKGVINQQEHPVNLPYSYRTGIVPDVMINPSALPSRMTVGFLKEAYYGIGALLRGETLNSSPFRNFVNEDNIYNHGYDELIAKVNQRDYDEITRETLRTYGYDEMGNETMVSGITGKVLKNPIFIGPTAYQALKHRPIDKNQFRGIGQIVTQTRQPTYGRTKNGGLRVGNMESDAYKGYGAAYLLRYFLCEASDAYTAIFCKKCGIFAEFDPYKKHYICRLCNGRNQRLEQQYMLAKQADDNKYKQLIQEEMNSLNTQYQETYLNYTNTLASGTLTPDQIVDYEQQWVTFEKAVQARYQELTTELEHSEPIPPLQLHVPAFGKMVIPYILKLFMQLMSSIGLLVSLDMQDHDDMLASMSQPQPIITDYDPVGFAQDQSTVTNNVSHFANMDIGIDL